eukprot:scaffold1744_cov252-Pinguiococcus_pyrenoidosus.AAC.12
MDSLRSCGPAARCTGPAQRPPAPPARPLTTPTVPAWARQCQAPLPRWPPCQGERGKCEEPCCPRTSNEGAAKLSLQ